MDSMELVKAPNEFRVGIKTRVFNWSLDRAIKAKGWKRAEAAKAFGVTVQTLFHWLAFKSYPRENKRMDVSIVLGVPEETIFPEGIEGFRVTKQPEPISFGKDEAVALGLLKPETDPEQIAIKNQEPDEQESLQESLQWAMQGLRENEKRVLKLRFGSEEEEPLSLRDSGVVLGLSRERIRQIEGKALRKLRRSPSSSTLLRPYVGR